MENDDEAVVVVINGEEVKKMETGQEIIDFPKSNNIEKEGLKSNNTTSSSDNSTAHRIRRYSAAALSLVSRVVTSYFWVVFT